MKATDLMIGDFIMTPAGVGKVLVINVADNDTWIKIEGGNGGRLDGCEPIPLTEEILLKNGWEIATTVFSWRGKGGYVHINLHNILPYGGVRIKIGSYNNRGMEMTNCLFRNITYVHELQHALRLCGIDKEITL